MTFETSVPQSVRDTMAGLHATTLNRRQRPALLLPGALLMAVGSQLLAALVLVDLRLTTFLQRSHTMSVSTAQSSIHDLIERILNDPFRSGSLQ